MIPIDTHEASVPRRQTLTELVAAMEEHRPLVVPIDRLVDRSPALKSLEAFARDLGSLELELHPNYLDGSVASLARYLRTGDDADLQAFVDDPKRRSSVDEYVASMNAGTTEGWVAVEQPCPGRFIDALGVIHDRMRELGVEQIVPGIPKRADTAGSYFYLAPAGQYSDLHFDRDGSHVLNLQLFGRKRFTLFPPSSGRFLHPIMHWGGVKLRGLSPSHLAGFLTYANGSSVVLEPGEAIHIPPFYWHHVEYLDHALGVGLRLYPPTERMRHVLTRVHPDYRLQAVAAHVLRHHPHELGPLEELEPWIADNQLTPEERYAGIDTWLAERVECMQLLDGREPVVPSTTFAARVLEAFYLRHGPPAEPLASAPSGAVDESSWIRIPRDLRAGRFEAEGFHAWRADGSNRGAQLASRVMGILMRFGGEGRRIGEAGIDAEDHSLVAELVDVGMLEVVGDAGSRTTPRTT